MITPEKSFQVRLETTVPLKLTGFERLLGQAQDVGRGLGEAEGPAAAVATPSVATTSAGATGMEAGAEHATHGQDLKRAEAFARTTSKEWLGRRFFNCHPQKLKRRFVSGMDDLDTQPILPEEHLAHAHGSPQTVATAGGVAQTAQHELNTELNPPPSLAETKGGEHQQTSEVQNTDGILVQAGEAGVTSNLSDNIGDVPTHAASHLEVVEHNEPTDVGADEPENATPEQAIEDDRTTGSTPKQRLAAFFQDRKRKRLAENAGQKDASGADMEVCEKDAQEAVDGVERDTQHVENPPLALPEDWNTTPHVSAEQQEPPKPRGRKKKDNEAGEENDCPREKPGSSSLTAEKAKTPKSNGKGKGKASATPIPADAADRSSWEMSREQKHRSRLRASPSARARSRQQPMKLSRR